ncbi:hypothetical protein QFC20_000061 [Naganishia adeliensis]|uniref:Uncharacterized protein n=1 Tax=Naganishia adeliensis TaxID=92952 RepID=A0ACC2X4V1_9TREE|nr:hypothetical protein QFC20_000061 [Naganishia adeliensis]
MEDARHGNPSTSAKQNSQISASPYKPKILIPKRRQANRAVTGSSTSDINSAMSSTSINSGVDQEKALRPFENMAKRPLTTVYDQAIQRVQEWNAALNAGPKPPLKTVRRKPNLHENPGPTGPSGAHTLDVGQSSSGSLEAHLKAIADQPQAIWKRNLMDGRDVSSIVTTRLKDDQEGNVWDNDFAGSPDLAKFAQGRPPKPSKEEADNARTIRPIKSPIHSPDPSAAEHGANSIGKFPVSSVPMWLEAKEDYSADLDFDENAFSQKISRLRQSSTGQKRESKQDMIQTARAPSPSQPPTPSKLPKNDSVPRRPRLISPQSPLSRSISRSNSFRGAEVNDEQAKQTLSRLSKYAEVEDEGYDDVFIAEDEKRFGSINSTSSDPLKLNVKRVSKALGEDEDNDDEANDPFAEIEDSFTAFDVEANLIRDKNAMICGSINRMIDDLQPSSPEEVLREASQGLLSLLEGSLELQDHFVVAHGMLAVLEVLETKPSRDVTLNLLGIVNMAVAADLSVMEHICLTGGIPVIMVSRPRGLAIKHAAQAANIVEQNFISKRYSLETRLEASLFVRRLTSSALTLQMFISCRGIRMLVELLDEDYSVNKILVLNALEGVETVFNLQSPTPKNEFCRMFVREGVAEPLSTALLNIVKDNSEEAETSKKRILLLLLLFCQTGQSDARIRDAFGSRSFVICLLRSLPRLSPSLLLIGLRSIKHLSTSQPLLDVLQNADAIRTLIDLLGEKIGAPGMNEICSHVLQTLFNLCRLSRSRQEEAAQNGLLPLLQQIIKINSPLKEFALPLLCDMANAGKSARRQLWKIDGVQRCQRKQPVLKTVCWRKVQQKP